MTVRQMVRNRAPAGGTGTVLPQLMTRPPRIDPRTKLVALLVVNVLAYGRVPQTMVFVLAAVTIACLSAVLPARAGIGWLVAFAAMAWLWLALPRVWTGVVPGLLTVVGYWGTRMMVSIGMAVAVLMSTQPAHLRAALAAWRVPSVLAVPITVLFRFFPIAWGELTAIREAMQVRGIDPGWRGWLTHPLRSAEYLLVPFLASSSRVADDLSASAVVRGLGAPTRPTSAIPLRWGLADVGIAAALAGIIAWAVLGEGTLGGGLR